MVLAAISCLSGNSFKVEIFKISNINSDQAIYNVIYCFCNDIYISLIQATEAEVFGTAYLSAYHFSKNNPKGLVYIMGSEAMESELNAMGFKSIGVGKGTILYRLYSLYY